MKVHLVHSGSLSALHTTRSAPKPIALYTPKRSGVISRTARKNPMYQVCETFKVYGVNANPFKAGTTSGHGDIVSRRNTCVYTHA
jgi:hypothetical protein